ncbi:hypothetical protein ACQ4M3_07740 [Leptolyngbya sp. AN03gr2]|uniref:hypothetical protein n=1 Tax=unclassified Leptolyngbya TaxID=2650499 RepID=UPI003D31C34E
MQPESKPILISVTNHPEQGLISVLYHSNETLDDILDRVCERPLSDLQVDGRFADTKVICDRDSDVIFELNCDNPHVIHDFPELNWQHSGSPLRPPFIVIWRASRYQSTPEHQQSATTWAEAKQLVYQKGRPEEKISVLDNNGNSISHQLWHNEV